MHVILGYIFVSLSILLLLAYLVLPCLLLPLFQRIVAFFRQKGYAECWSFLWFLLPQKRKAAIGVALMMALFIFSIYGYQRFIWMGKDNANYTAKEYFVAGQPLCGVRWVLCTYLNPENPFVVPLNALQQLIYKQGVKYLPEDDGERGVWDDLWFLYPYTRRMHRPYGTNSYKPSYGMRRLLDQMYDAITVMATHPIADQQMEREKALINFPELVFYFHVHKGFYEDKRFGSAKPLLQRKERVEQIRELYHWIVELRSKWIAAGLYDKIKREQPDVEALRQMLAINLSGDLLYASIFTGDFTCRHPLIPDYPEGRREFTDPKAANYVWDRLHRRQSSLAEDFYVMTIDSYDASFHRYVLENYCGLEVSGEERYYGKIDKKFSKKDRIPALKSMFHEELKLIEEEIDE